MNKNKTQSTPKYFNIDAGLRLDSSALHAEGHRFEPCSAHHFLASFTHFMSFFKTPAWSRWSQNGVKAYLYFTSFISISMLLIFGYTFAVSPLNNFQWGFVSNLYGEQWFEFIVCPISAITTSILIIATITKPNWYRGNK